DEPALRASVGAFAELRAGIGPLAVDRPRNLVDRSRSLYDTLLKPAEPLISRYDRILILPDGPLHTLPLPALIRDGKDGKPRYLMEWKPITPSVSATVYAELRRGRPAWTVPAVEVAAFGDPKYPTLPEKKVVLKRGNGEESLQDVLADEYSEVEDPQVRS